MHFSAACQCKHTCSNGLFQANCCPRTLSCCTYPAASIDDASQLYPCDRLDGEHQDCKTGAQKCITNAGTTILNLPMFDWNDLRHFLAIARYGSTLAAARALRVSQSTVHRRMDELERQVGRQLVTRNPTGYKLTELGEDLVAYAIRVEEAALAFQRRVAAVDTNLTGAVRVTCPEPVGIRLMQSTLLAKFSERYPGLRVEFVMSDKLRDLGKGEADIAFRAAAPEDNALFGRKIADVPWAIYASSDYVAQHGVVKNVEDIGSHALVLFDVELKEHFTNRWLQSAAPNARI